MMMMYGKSNPLETKAVLFDMDGTVLDTIHLIVSSLEYTWQYYTGHIPDERLTLGMIGRPLLESFPGLEDRIDEVVTTYRDWSQHKTRTHTGIYLGIVPLFETLSQQGFRLGIVTARHRFSMQECLDVYDLNRFLDITIAHEDSAGHKPGPDPLLEAARRLALKPADILYVGDSAHDVACAKAAGCPVAVVDWTSMDKEALRAMDPDMWIERAEDLPRMITH